MHLAKLKLRDFRNFRRLDVAFEPGFHVLLGRNAQGKTNLLEAVYLLATLRSFRGVGNAQIIRHEQRAFFAGGLALGQAESDIRYYWSAAQRKLTVNEKPIRRVADYLGALRTVVFCTEDSLLVNGPTKSRRRFLDLLLTQTRPGSLELLARIDYAPSVREDFAVDLAKSRAREQRYRTTLVGPHRDELKLTLDGQPAAQYASEGQKRTFAIALKMAQADYLGGIHGSPPILLIDDVMGELDASRRAGLVPLISRVGQALGQVFMTCTEENWPGELTGNLHRWQIDQGAVSRKQ